MTDRTYPDQQSTGKEQSKQRRYPFPPVVLSFHVFSQLFSYNIRISLSLVFLTIIFKPFSSNIYQCYRYTYTLLLSIRTFRLNLVATVFFLRVNSIRLF